MRVLIGIALAALIFLPPTAEAQGMFQCGAPLYGRYVVPPTASPGEAQFRAAFVACAACGPCDGLAPVDSLQVIFEYQALAGVPIGAAIYVGQPGANGTLLHVITQNGFASNDTLYVMILADDCHLLENGGCYVTIATDLYPGGEVRGQLNCAVSPTTERSWGTLRVLYR
jgi:hypothetical protein